jgi:hypothetical protein
LEDWIQRPAKHKANMDNEMTRAVVLGATALTLSAAIASAQAGYVTDGAGNVALLGGLIP